MRVLAKPMRTCVCASCVVMMAPPSMMAMMMALVALKSRKLNEIETKLNEIETKWSKFVDLYAKI